MHVSKSGQYWIIAITLQNNSNVPALMVRLKAIGKESCERILPVFYRDNYFSVMPGEKRTVTIRMDDRDTRGERPAVEVSGFNLLQN